MRVAVPRSHLHAPSWAQSQRSARLFPVARRHTRQEAPSWRNRGTLRNSRRCAGKPLGLPYWNAPSGWRIVCIAQSHDQACWYGSLHRVSPCGLWKRPCPSGRWLSRLGRGVSWHLGRWDDYVSLGHRLRGHLALHLHRALRASSLRSNRWPDGWPALQPRCRLQRA